MAVVKQSTRASRAGAGAGNSAPDRKLMLQIPKSSTRSPIGTDDSCNVEVQRFGEPALRNMRSPYHTESRIAPRFDMDAAGRVTQRLLLLLRRRALLSLWYARDFMIQRASL
jgi:seryl-tRNA synthetase